MQGRFFYGLDNAVLQRRLSSIYYNYRHIQTSYNKVARVVSL